ncbi:FecR domain-containing protein [uncultured Brachyspira sp.]|uniref:FecR domain-containing protein n=1 Tax=uncultured Brachyspira sp. TaxID=221953 RepID=UPI00260E033F|nr:FecR domain-containing protein [uncultured Brachyspira sp.]
MFNKIFLTAILFALLFSNTLLPQDISFKVTEISGLAFIEKTDISRTLRAFRGSEVHSDYRLRTSSNTQAELTLTRRGDKVGTIIVPQNTIILINSTSEKDDNTISLSLLAGYMKVNIMKDIGSLIEVHTPNMSSIVKGTQFDVAFAENGSSIVVLRDGSIDVVTDNDQRILNPKEAYINTIDNNSRVINQNADSDPIVFLNKGEEDSREDYIYTIENLMKAMENIPYNNENFVSLVNIEESEKQLKDMELKQYRMIAANEGYYNTIIKLINLQPSKKNEMIAYARKSLTIYTANQKAISKMNTSVTKTREKFDRIRRKFDERMSASAN